MIRGNTIKAKQNLKTYVDSLIDLSEYDVPHRNQYRAIREICSTEMHAPWSIDTFNDWCQGLPSAFNSADFLYNGTPYDALSRIYETNPEEQERFEKRVRRSEAEARIIRMCYKALSE